MIPRFLTPGLLALSVMAAPALAQDDQPSPTPDTLPAEEPAPPTEPQPAPAQEPAPVPDAAKTGHSMAAALMRRAIPRSIR